VTGLWLVGSVAGAVLGSLIGTVIGRRLRRRRGTTMEIALSVRDGVTELVTAPWWRGARPLAWLLLSLVFALAAVTSLRVLQGRLSAAAQGPTLVIELAGSSLVALILMRGRRWHAVADAATRRLGLHRAFEPPVEVLALEAVALEHLPASPMALERWRIVAIPTNGAPLPVTAELVHHAELVEGARALASALGVPLRAA
jgi:hypothetical protein